MSRRTGGIDVAEPDRLRSIRLPADLARAVDDYAQQRGWTVNHLVKVALARRVGFKLGKRR